MKNISWKKILDTEFQKEYFKKIDAFIANEKEKGKTVFPKPSDIYNAFKLTPLKNVKVVILGQDPYHGNNQAHGLSFSVKKGQKIPPSLKNIYKEIHTDLNLDIPNHGFLESWATQGVFLLNAVLTVNAKEPASHKKAGWEIFTDHIIQTISNEKENIVFLLWGNFAKNKAVLIDTEKHLVLESAHPSPFSAYNGFFSCKHFSKTNMYLKEKGIEKIDWQIKSSNSLF